MGSGGGKTHRNRRCKGQAGKNKEQIRQENWQRKCKNERANLSPAEQAACDAGLADLLENKGGSQDMQGQDTGSTSAGVPTSSASPAGGQSTTTVSGGGNSTGNPSGQVHTASATAPANNSLGQGPPIYTPPRVIGCEPEPEKERVERLRKQYVKNRKLRPLYNGPTNLVFYTPAELDWRVLSVWAFLTVLWLSALPETAVIDWGWFGIAIKIAEIAGMPINIMANICMEIFFSMGTGGVPFYCTRLGMCVVFAAIESAIICRYWCHKDKIPAFEFLCLVKIFRASPEKVARIQHQYTKISHDKDGTLEVDVRPDCSARSTVKHLDPDMGRWTYERSIRGTITKRRVISLSNEAFSQVAANPRLMHLRGDEATIKAQIKMTVGTLETVNIDRDTVFDGVSISANLEAVVYAFYMHVQREGKCLPF